MKFENIVYRLFVLLRAVKITTFDSKMVIFPVRNVNNTKFDRELHRAIFSAFYKNSQLNFANLLLLRCSFEMWCWSSFFLSGSKAPEVSSFKGVIGYLTGVRIR